MVIITTMLLSMDNCKHHRKIFVLIILTCLAIFGVVIFHRKVKLSSKIVLQIQELTAKQQLMVQTLEQILVRVRISFC